MGANWLDWATDRFGWAKEQLESLVHRAGSFLKAPQEDRNEAVQQVYLDLAKHFGDSAPSFATVTALENYVWATALNATRKLLRARRSRREVSLSDPEARQSSEPVSNPSGDPAFSGDRNAVLEELTEEQKAGLLNLLPPAGNPPTLRDVMRLRLQGMTEEAIADVLGSSTPTVSRRLKDAKRYVVLGISDIVRRHEL
jgi:RNA polymerase sigma factor (sigma-70 family)